MQQSYDLTLRSSYLLSQSAADRAVRIVGVCEAAVFVLDRPCQVRYPRGVISGLPGWLAGVTTGKPGCLR